VSAATGAVLCVANYAANTGYAWDFIEGLYARLADHLATHGIRTYVAYPTIPAPPRALAGSAAVPVKLQASLATAAGISATLRFIRHHRVRLLYLTDRNARSLLYPLVRAAGARVLVHDHTSGARIQPRGVKRLGKGLLAKVPGLTADVVVAVSDYVASRQTEVGLIPARRVVRVWNGLSVSEQPPTAGLQSLFGLASDRPVIACACRATPEKGVDVLLRAYVQLLKAWPPQRPRPILVYIGSGPQFGELALLRDRLELGSDAILVGYRQDAAAILAGAQVCVVPSVWQDAFPLSVLETMALGKAIVAAAVGGIPEMIEADVTGLLVPPADEAALAVAIRALLDNPTHAAQLGAAAQRRVRERFNPDRQLAELAGLVEAAFGPPCAFARNGVRVRA
jgi:glycosyltransferase involved in cell wall biosynthesis